MVRKIFSILNSEIRGLHQAAYLLGATAILSQVLGLLRDRLLAGTFGAGLMLDVYFAAFRIPDLIFIITASIVSISALIPAITKKESEGKKEALLFLNSIFTFFFILVISVCIIVYFIIPFIMPFLFNGFDDNTLKNYLIPITRLMLFSPILLGISNMFSSISQLHSKFALYAISPILYNLGIIIGVILLYPIFGFYGLGIGVVLGALMHMAIQLPFIIQSGYFPKLKLRPNIQAIKRIIRISIPRTLALSAHQVTLLFLTIFGSMIAVGSIAVFTLAYNLQSVPISIIGVSYSVAAFPLLSKLYYSGKHVEFLHKVSISLRHILFWSLPFMTLFIVLRAQIVRVVYGFGEFGWSATRLAAASLAIFSISILAQALLLLFTRAYYAAGRTRAPLIINLLGAFSILTNALLLLWLFKTNPWFRHILTIIMKVENVPGTIMLMLPIAYSLGMIISALIMWIKFQRDFGRLPGLIRTTFFHSMLGALVVGITAFLLLDLFDNYVNLFTVLGVFIQGALSGAGGIIAGIIFLKFIKNRELMELSTAIQIKFWKRKTVFPQVEERTSIM